ncbi:MAG: DUF4136 domain-containing protein [Ignavibacteria bacterium]|nr:DUF4136 domain-containing protein [Ignavibacteriota bacterium]
MKKRNFVLGLLMLGFLAAASMTIYSCYPYNSTNPAEYDVVVTLHDALSNYNGSYKKYVMRDSVAHVTDGSAGTTITRSYDTLIRNKVRDNLASFGYTRVYDTLSADVVITLAITNSTSYYVDNYYPDDYWGWGYGGGYYYPWSSAYSVTTGSVVTTMTDKKKMQPGTTKKAIVWMGILNGVVDGTTSTMYQRISAGIDKCFSQSLYLKAQ